MFSRRALIGTAAIAVAGATGAVLWKARANKAQVFTGILPGVAIGGYDAVAYFTEGIPTPGREDISLQHDGATWRFSSDEHRRTFRADPSRYAPRYGGYCAYAVAGGGTSGASPKAWRLVEGRLISTRHRACNSTGRRTFPDTSGKPMQTGRRSSANKGNVAGRSSRAGRFASCVKVGRIGDTQDAARRGRRSHRRRPPRG